ncbi:hypothetical protein JCM31826_11750 [Thermaurantimonas aggregans]|uniref:Cell shape determination protein CcmA n=1 Tax=Thermaurantimonas aggregans TaxID=2173829 RepID=A0A401XL20_9FLAO|nr:polymer-forming cytoskeletal protein [Thermaurantimonas aggregans]MCX8148267.1 polymer-forming cytoskeletal protein [Thermaurantimonas aggregans]GCD77693.1 hypothetical protein JCM31826_11750 [Thermaurantimonas aggregans]
MFKKESQPITISNRILQGTVVRGNIESEGDLRIDGEILGDITIKGKMVIGADGKIVGNIKCASAKIEGKLIGDIEADDAVHLLSQCFVEGNIHTRRLIVEEGGVFNGSCFMTNEKVSSPQESENVSV